MQQFQVIKTKIEESRIVNQTSSRSLEENEIRLKIEKFAVTSNNITYAVAGDKLGYWQFFPPLEDIDSKDNDNSVWGVIPVWGFAQVVESNNDEVSLGERFFGYFPPASNLILKPSNVNKLSFIESSAHRVHLPVAYNIYRKVEHPATLTKQEVMLKENERMLLYPLHVTSFALYDFFDEHDWFGAEQVILLSASSKTSTGLAYGIKHKRPDLRQIGVTSARNLPAVEGLEVYDIVLDYKNLQHIDSNKPTVIIDMSGNSEVISSLHKQLKDNMKYCSKVGITHKDAFSNEPFYIKERTHMFFAPSQIQQKIKVQGMQAFNSECTHYLEHSYKQSRNWLEIEELAGLEGLQQVFLDICGGKIDPTKGLIVKMV